MTAKPLIDALAAIPPAEWTAVALALAYLVLAVRQHIACWLFAAASSAIFLWLFARAGLVHAGGPAGFLYRDGGVWLVLVARRPARCASFASRRPLARGGARVRHFSSRACYGPERSAVSVGGGRVPSGPICRCARGLGSVLTTWLVARKVLENWLYWIVLDSLAAALYWSQGLHATAVLFVLYAGIAIQGYRSWRTSIGAPRSSAAAA